MKDELELLNNEMSSELAKSREENDQKLQQMSLELAKTREEMDQKLQQMSTREEMQDN